MKTAPLFIFMGAIGLLVFLTQAQASQESLAHQLSTAAGIASPSESSAITENPAGLIFNTDSEIFGLMGTPNDSFNPLLFGGRFLTGNGSVGGGVGFEQTSDGNELIFGLAASIPVADMAIGFSGFRSMPKSGGGDWDADLGVIFKPKNDLHFGAALYHVVGGLDAVGAGVAFDAGSTASIGLDGAYQISNKGITLKPALTIYLQQLQLTAGYGIKVSNGGGWIRDGFAAGLGFNLSHSVHFEAYYNQIERYFFGVAFHF